jgi:hypothetical protein
MRIRDTIVAAGFLTILGGVLLTPSEAAAQTTAVRPIVPRDGTWGTVSNVTMVVGAGIVTLMPRIFYNNPEATVGWKGRWHFSMFAPALSMTALTLLMDGPVRGAIKKPRPGCSAEQTAARLRGSECESYGMMSTQSYASWGATGAGTTIFLVDTLKYSDGKFNAGGFVGNIAVPLVLSVLTSVGRGITVGTDPTTGVARQAFETPEQVALGAVTGFASGALIGLAYSLFQRPTCGYGNHVFCW